ncbi:MAG: hypothetical protein WC516_09280 [Patescibacteria group bacterium]|jgi:hypothetical protein
MNNLILTRWIIFMLIVVGCYMAYIIKGDKPFIYEYFWRTVHYIIIWMIPFGTAIILLPMRFNVLTTMAIWTLIIFFGSLLIFNTALSNLDIIKFKEKINSRTFSLFFVLLEGAMLTIVAIIELCAKWFK